MTATTKSLIVAVSVHGVSTLLVSTVVQRALAGADVRAFAVIKHTGPDGHMNGVTAAAVAGNQFHYWWWGPAQIAEADAVDAQIARMEQMLTGDEEAAPVVEPAPTWPVFVRSAPLSSVVDVRTDMAVAVDGTLRSVEVLVTSPLLDAFSLAPSGCDDPECPADHGYHGWVVNENARLALEAPDATPQDLEQLADFGAALAAAAAGR